MDEPKPKHSARLLIVVLVVIIIGLLIALWWCWWGHKSPSATPGPTTPGTTATTGPCTGGLENVLPADFTFYENATLGYKFAYPSAWGSVTVTTAPIASESGDYVMGRFSTNEQAWFGGNATDYAVRGRDGIPTDLPGYLKAGSNYYTVELWKFNNGTSLEDRHDLHPIAPPHEEKAGCNTTALLTQIDVSELSSIGPADVAHFNLKPGSHYYGVNFVLDHPTATSREQFSKLIKSFQLLD